MAVHLTGVQRDGSRLFIRFFSFHNILHAKHEYFVLASMAIATEFKLCMLA